MCHVSGGPNSLSMDRYQSVDCLDPGLKKGKVFLFVSILFGGKRATSVLWCCGELKTKFSGAVFRKEKTNDETAKGPQSKQKQSCI